MSVSVLRRLLTEASTGMPWWCASGGRTISGKGGEVATLDYDDAEADAALIVAAVNALPDLLALHDAAKAYVDEPGFISGEIHWAALRAVLVRLDESEET